MTTAQKALLARLQAGCVAVRGPYQAWTVGSGIAPQKCAVSTLEALERRGYLKQLGGWVPVATWVAL